MPCWVPAGAHWSWKYLIWCFWVKSCAESFAGGPPYRNDKRACYRNGVPEFRFSCEMELKSVTSHAKWGSRAWIFMRNEAPELGFSCEMGLQSRDFHTKCGSRAKIYMRNVAAEQSFSCEMRLQSLDFHAKWSSRRDFHAKRGSRV